MNNTNKALAEVNDILHHINKNLYIKIPPKMIQIIEENMDTTYIPNIDYTKSINEQELLKETRIILSLLYRDYICSPEKKIELTKSDIENLRQKKSKSTVEYDYDKLFKNKKSKEDEMHKKSDEMIVYKKSFIQKLIDHIKNIFTKN